MRRHPLIVDSVFQHSSITDKQFNTGLQVRITLDVRFQKVFRETFCRLSAMAEENEREREGGASHEVKKIGR